MPTSVVNRTRIAYGAPATPEQLNYLTEGIEYHRCNWLVEVNGGIYLCMLLPHEGREHKVLYQDNIRTYEVEERKVWWK